MESGVRAHGTLVDSRGSRVPLWPGLRSTSSARRRRRVPIFMPRGWRVQAAMCHGRVDWPWSLWRPCTPSPACFTQALGGLGTRLRCSLTHVPCARCAPEGVPAGGGVYRHRIWGTRVPSAPRRWVRPPNLSARFPAEPLARTLILTRCGIRHARAGGDAMPEAVIVAAGRSPIGRAFKGHLVQTRADDLAAYVVGKVLERVPQLEPGMIDDLICGCGLPGGEQGFNLGRVVSILARLDTPGCTVTRYCSSSLQTTRMAYHAIKAGEGDTFVSVGVECVSRLGNGSSDMPDARNPRLLPGNAEEYPDIYISMGQTAE